MISTHEWFYEYEIKNTHIEMYNHLEKILHYTDFGYCYFQDIKYVLE